jgi:hypothetical protein
MMGILGLALASVVAGQGESFCSLMQFRGMRPRNAVELSLRATTDSLPELNRIAGNTNETGYRQRLSWDTATVYAQVFQVDRVDGNRDAFRSREFRRVAVVWWRLGLQCQRVSPKPAVRRDVPELFLPAFQIDRRDSIRENLGASFAELRPEGQWIGGIPTLDIVAGAWTYSPDERRPENLPPTQGALTISEFRDLFERLPIVGASYSESQLRWHAMLRWGDADARRWTRYPAAQFLCNAVTNLGDTTLAQGRCH